LAEAALSVVDGVLFVLPRALPHKEYSEATLDERSEMLRRIVPRDPRLGAAISEGGLFIEIAREVREHYPKADLHFICGRDAAERIVSWDYGDPGAFERMLHEFRLLVARRQGDYDPPANLRRYIHELDMPGFDDCSSTRLKERIAGGGNWRELAPEEIAHLIGQVYVTRNIP